MQVFLPYEDNLKNCAQSLDDSRLNKQIVELCQILTVQYNIRYSQNPNIGYASHPVVQQYNTNNGILFLLQYGTILCDEFQFRMGKVHQGCFTLLGLKLKYSRLGFSYKHIQSFKTFYIKGRKGKDQIITDESVSGLYQKLLCEKWKSEKPKWTKRTQPEFYVRPGGV